MGQKPVASQIGRGGNLWPPSAIGAGVALSGEAAPRGRCTVPPPPIATTITRRYPFAPIDARAAGPAAWAQSDVGAAPMVPRHGIKAFERQRVRHPEARGRKIHHNEGALLVPPCVVVRKKNRENSPVATPSKQPCADTTNPHPAAPSSAARNFPDCRAAQPRMAAALVPGALGEIFDDGRPAHAARQSRGASHDLLRVEDRTRAPDTGRRPPSAPKIGGSGEKPGLVHGPWAPTRAQAGRSHFFRLPTANSDQRPFAHPDCAARHTDPPRTAGNRINRAGPCTGPALERIVENPRHAPAVAR